MFRNDYLYPGWNCFDRDVWDWRMGQPMGYDQLRGD
jgi:hypothetical protein